LLIVSITGSLAFGIFVAVFKPFQDPINRKNFEKIKLGMTEAEVEAILGPATERKDVSGCSVALMLAGLDGDSCQGSRQVLQKTWKGVTRTIRVEFVEGGTVAYGDIERTKDSLWDMIRGWFGLEQDEELIGLAFHSP
jgi:hypothetical protein